jgi:hypothetical protein
MATREAAAGGVARVRVAVSGGEGVEGGVAAGAGVAATTAFVSGSGTETATASDVSGVPLPASAANERLCSPGANAGGMMTNWPEASAVTSATALPASRSSTLAFGAARPAMTASPAGSTFTTSKAGLSGEAAASPGAVLSMAGAAGGTLGAIGSGARATACAGAGFGHRKLGWVQSSAPATAPAATTVDAAAPPTQTSVLCDTMFFRFRAGLYRESDHGDKCLVTLPSFRRSAYLAESRSRQGDARFLR